MKDIKVAKAASTSDDILVRVGAASHDRLDLVHGLGQGILVILVFGEPHASVLRGAHDIGAVEDSLESGLLVSGKSVKHGLALSVAVGEEHGHEVLRVRDLRVGLVGATSLLVLNLHVAHLCVEYLSL